MLTGLLRDLAALIVTFCLTGWLLGLVVIPRALGVTPRALLSLALSVPATVLLATPGLILHRLTPLSFSACLAALAALAGWTSHRRAGDDSRRGGRLGVRKCIAALDLEGLVLSALAAAVGWLAVMGPQIATRRPDGLPRQSTVWYYWWLVEETIRDGGIPSTISEWGQPRPFPVEYAVTTVHTAATTMLAGGPGVDILERYRLFEVGIAMIALYALWRRWAPAWWAWMASVLSMATIRLTIKFLAYVPEAFGLILVLWSGWLLDEAFERGSKRWAALAGSCRLARSSPTPRCGCSPPRCGWA